MVIAGGFHGSVSGDVLAYTLPNALSMKRNDKVCSLYGSQIRLVAGSRRKLLHSSADGIGEGAKFWSLLLEANPLKPCYIF